MKRTFLTILGVYHKHELVSGTSKKFVFGSDKRLDDRFWHSMPGINNSEKK